jgi:proteic killer suppression protein
VIRATLCLSLRTGSSTDSHCLRLDYRLASGGSQQVAGRYGGSHSGAAAALDEAESVDDLNRPSFRLHPLKGDLKGFWSMTVRANWRIVFRFVDGEALEVDFTDYH